MSIEALAMAGIDHTVCSIKLEEWENGDLQQPPPHLLGEKNYSIEVGKVVAGVSMAKEEECIKARIRGWAKAVAAMNETALPLKTRCELSSLCR